MDVLTSDDQILIKTKLPASIELVWAALTTPAAIASWWGKHVSLEPRVGGELHETWWNDQSRQVATTGTITTFDPPHTLAMTWIDEDWTQATRLRITLREEAEGRTTLRLVHEGWTALPEERRQPLIDAHVDGWSYHLRSLLGYLLQQAKLL